MFLCGICADELAFGCKQEWVAGQWSGVGCHIARCQPPACGRGQLKLLRGCHVGETGQSVVAGVLGQRVLGQGRRIGWGPVVPVGAQLGWG